MTLEYSAAGNEWVMITKNASNRAYHRGIPMPRYFGTLIEVEAAYKSFKGVVALCDGLDVPNVREVQPEPNAALKAVMHSC